MAVSLVIGAQSAGKARYYAEIGARMQQLCLNFSKLAGR
jgi:hypothetical protein